MKTILEIDFKDGSKLWGTEQNNHLCYGTYNDGAAEALRTFLSTKDEKYHLSLLKKLSETSSIIEKSFFNTPK